VLALIRINLIGRPGGAAKRGKGGKLALNLPDIPNVGILLFALLLVMEGAAFFLWQTSASDEATRATSRLALRKKEISELETTKAAIVATQAEVTKLESQKVVFDVLLAEKAGPIGALHYLSFMLQPRAEAETAAEELKAMEAAGWRVAWDARKAWITSFREANGEVTLTGEALGHEDVAEVQRRMESSPYFRTPKLVFQEKKRDDKLGVNFVEFSIRASMVYLIEPMRPAEPAAAEGAAEAVPAAGEASAAQGAVIGGKLAAPLAAEASQAAGPAPAPAADAGASASDASDADAGPAKDAKGDSEAGEDADAAAEPKAGPDAAAAAPAPEAPPAAAKSAPPVDKAPLPTAPASAPPPAEAAADKLPAAE
jgi:hypothetical protein